MNIEGKTINTVVRHQDTGVLRIAFTDGSACDLELDTYRLVRIVPVYTTAQPAPVYPTAQPAPVAQPMMQMAECTSALDSQVAGDHYKKLGMYQPWQVLAAWMTPEELKGAAKKDAIGYLAREADKGGREDIEKAVHTLQIYLELSK